MRSLDNLPSHNTVQCPAYTVLQLMAGQVQAALAPVSAKSFHMDRRSVRFKGQATDVRVGVPGLGERVRLSRTF